MDTLERLAPETVTLFDRETGAAIVAPVLRTIAYPPGQAPDGAPIRRDLHTLELRTAHGSRWYGFSRAPWIGSDLRMHVLLDDSRDEVRMAWEQPQD